MPRRSCPRHQDQQPCSCAMGNLYRFVEPVLLLLLKQKGRSYGYELSNELKRYAFTNAEIEIAALYKTLRTLEENSCVTSEWMTDGSGPAKRVYALTRRGEEHLDEWVAVLTHISGSMKRFLAAAKREKEQGALAAAPSRG